MRMCCAAMTTPSAVRDASAFVASKTLFVRREWRTFVVSTTPLASGPRIWECRVLLFPPRARAPRVAEEPRRFAHRGLLLLEDRSTVSRGRSPQAGCVRGRFSSHVSCPSLAFASAAPRLCDEPVSHGPRSPSLSLSSSFPSPSLSRLRSSRPPFPAARSLFDHFVCAQGHGAARARLVSPSPHPPPPPGGPTLSWLFLPSRGIGPTFFFRFDCTRLSFSSRPSFRRRSPPRASFSGSAADPVFSERTPARS